MDPDSRRIQQAGLAARYRAVRAETGARVTGLTAEDAGVQSMPDASPAKWHLAHTTWFFETFILEHQAAGYTPFDRHRRHVAQFEIASRPATNAEYAAFIDDGGYRRPELWLSEGWALAKAQQWSQPLYWRKDGGRWLEFTLQGLQPLDPGRTVRHLSHFEADAFASWSGARLPTEFEWEMAAPSFRHGEVWEWASSSYGPYPGFKAAAGAVGEYNGKFMSNQYVLRGGSSATPQGHTRRTYRNFFPSHARWQFSGVRLARDVA